MIFLVLIVIFIASVLLGKYIFKNNINPISIYSTIWFTLLTFFHFKLIKYDDLSFYAWLLIIFSYFSFILGILVYYTSTTNRVRTPQKDESKDNNIPILFKNLRMLKILIVFFASIGIIGAIQHWMILLNKFGSIIDIFLRLGLIRQMTVNGQIEGILPYVSSFSFVAVFFAGIYSARKGRITLISALPLLAIILKDTAAAGRVGILIGFLEFALTYIFAAKYLNENKLRIKKKKNAQQYFSIGLILLVFLVSIFFIKGLRGGSEELTGAGRGISNLSNNVFITPTLYLYFSGHVGVLSKYLEKDIEKARFGENSFRFVYNILNKFNITDNADMYQRGYYIPVWINTGTYLRELHSDFGIAGTLLFVFFLGILISFLWFNYYESGSIIYLILLVYFNLIIALSFLMMITRLTSWSISLLILLLSVTAIEKYSNRKRLISD